MAGLSDKERQVISILKERLLDEFGERFDDARLFGSKARGDASKHSDVDVLVIIQDATWQDRRVVSGITSDVLLETGIFISPKVFSPEQLDDMKRRRSMFWQTIKPDLVKL